MKIEQKSIDKFWSKVQKTDGCWEWQGGRHPDGYGYFVADQKRWQAHRFSALLDGRDPSGWKVCHRCDNPSCVRPDHLFLGTQKDNMRDMVAKGRRYDSHGENNSFSKLTTQTVLAIRNDCENIMRNNRFPRNTLTPLSKKYNISACHIRDIARRKVWSHI